MQLVAYGAQDIYLTGNPQITFFKVVYRRHTNFSMEAIEQTFDGSINWGSRVSCTISRNGDLIHKMYIQYLMSNMIDTSASSKQHIIPKLGCGLLKEVELEIGGQRIDRHYSHWLSAFEDLTMKNNDGIFNNPTINTDFESGNFTKYQKLSGNFGGLRGGEAYNKVALNETIMPLQFWFCRNVGLALPLIALQYHEVKFYWTLPTASELETNYTDTPTPTSIKSSPGECKLFVDYIYLDTDERRRFAQVSHEYLIEQLQYESHSKSASLELNFNHPVKELIWGGKVKKIVKDEGYDFALHYTNGISDSTSFVRLHGTGGVQYSVSSESDFNITLKLNGHERFAPRGTTYFSRQQIYDYHTGPGCLTENDALCVYSFALKPEEHQPSGTCNFSRIDSAILQFNTMPKLIDTRTPEDTGGDLLDSIHVYAVNYNVLRIMSGMGGLAYSN